MPNKQNEGRPSKYKTEYCNLVNDYLKENQDQEIKVLKQANGDKGYEIYDTKIKVKLPTINGFSLFINIPRRTLYDWAETHEEFSHSLEKIVKEQEKRLLECGLSGDYNPTIAKLILSSNHGYKERNDSTSGDKPITIANLIQQLNAGTNKQGMENESSLYDNE